MPCPFKGKDNCECLLRLGGLYIPSSLHVKIYCLTENYDQCGQHERLAALTYTNGHGVTAPSGRRRFDRKPLRMPVTLRPVLASGEPAGLPVDGVYTVDLCRGGMRLRCASDLPEDVLWQFDFGDDLGADAPVPHANGLAEVRWRRALEGHGEQIEAGFLFLDQASLAGCDPRQGCN